MCYYFLNSVTLKIFKCMKKAATMTPKAVKDCSASVSVVGDMDRPEGPANCCAC
jgi:hypothetical protein